AVRGERGDDGLDGVGDGDVVDGAGDADATTGLVLVHAHDLASSGRGAGPWGRATKTRKPPPSGRLPDLVSTLARGSGRAALVGRPPHPQNSRALGVHERDLAGNAVAMSSAGTLV